MPIPQEPSDAVTIIWRWIYRHKLIERGVFTHAEIQERLHAGLSYKGQWGEKQMTALRAEALRRLNPSAEERFLRQQKLTGHQWFVMTWAAHNTIDGLFMSLTPLRKAAWWDVKEDVKTLAARGYLELNHSKDGKLLGLRILPEGIRLEDELEREKQKPQPAVQVELLEGKV